MTALDSKSPPIVEKMAEAIECAMMGNKVCLGTLHLPGAIAAFAVIEPVIREAMEALNNARTAMRVRPEQLSFTAKEHDAYNAASSSFTALRDMLGEK